MDRGPTHTRLHASSFPTQERFKHGVPPQGLSGLAPSCSWPCCYGCFHGRESLPLVSQAFLVAMISSPSSARLSGIFPGLSKLGCLAMDAVSMQRHGWRHARRTAQPCHSSRGVRHAEQLGSLCGRNPASASDVSRQLWRALSRSTAPSLPSISSVTVSCTACQRPGGSGAQFRGGDSISAAGQRQSGLWWLEHGPFRSPQKRPFRILPPIQMGRRAAKIATRKVRLPATCHCHAKNSQHTLGVDLTSGWPRLMKGCFLAFPFKQSRL